MVSDVPVGRDMVWRRRARSDFPEGVNGNGTVKQIGNTTLGGPVVVLTVGTTSVEDMLAAGHEGRMDLGAALAGDDGARSGSNSNNIRDSNNNRSSSSSSSRPHLSP